MVTLMTFALCEKDGTVGVVGLSTDGVTGLDAGGEVSNKSIISDVRSDLVFDEREEIPEGSDELALLDPLMLPLRACPNCGSNK